MPQSISINDFQLFAEERCGQNFRSYEELHEWSVQQPNQFWSLLWEYDQIASPDPVFKVLAKDIMPGAVWFPNRRVNYTKHVLRHASQATAAHQPAIIAEDEIGRVEVIPWSDLQARIYSLARSLRRLGVGPGDTVAAYLPNRPEAIISFLACAAIGAVWTICSPDMGVPAILDRFMQVEPKVLIATDCVRYAGKIIDLSDKVAALHDALSKLEALIMVHSGLGNELTQSAFDFSELTHLAQEEIDDFQPEWLPFDHPLWVVYSSGTTGKPKALVHGHGGVLLGSAAGRLHSNLQPSYAEASLGSRFHWYSSTGWMMWNTQVGGLLGGTTICIYDGSPTGSSDNPDVKTLWRFASRHKITFFGAGAPFYAMCQKAGLDFRDVDDLSHLHTLGSTASPLPAAVQTGLSQQLEGAGYCDIWWFNSSGGTDICGAFCTGNRGLPEAPGKLQCRQLGAAVEAWNEAGESILGEVGELVCTRPLPNMPLYLWGDNDGARYKQSYFDTFSGIWRHGDWIKIDNDGTCEIFGRSDATINRAGHRMGTSEIYSAIEKLDFVGDSMVIDVRVPNAESKLLLFVAPSSGSLREADFQRIVAEIKKCLSPRFVPDQIIEVSEVPRTLSGKKQELPIKRLFEGEEIEEVMILSAMSNPDCISEYISIAKKFANGI